MKTKILFIVIFCFLFIQQAKSQKDEKRMGAIKSAIEQDKDYEKALSLLGKISEKGQETFLYQTYLAKSLEATGNFDLALLAYQKCATFESDTISTAKIIELQRKIEIRKKCFKCKGEGYVIVEKRCTYCQGLGEMTIPCPKCNGKKKVECGGCYGSGRVSNGQNSMVSCSRCGGSGFNECNRCNSLGTSTNMCKYCKGGTIQEKVKCTEHE